MRPPNILILIFVDALFLFDKWWNVWWMDVWKGPGQMGKPGSKTGSPSSDSSISSTPAFSSFANCISLRLWTVFLFVCKLYLSYFTVVFLRSCQLYFSKTGSPSSALSINSTPSSSSTWFSTLSSKSTLWRGGGDGWELWKPCLLSKLWTGKPEKPKQGSEPPNSTHPPLNCASTISSDAVPYNASRRLGLWVFSSPEQLRAEALTLSKCCKCNTNNAQLAIHTIADLVLYNARFTLNIIDFFWHTRISFTRKLLFSFDCDETLWSWFHSQQI